MAKFQSMSSQMNESRKHIPSWATNRPTQAIYIMSSTLRPPKFPGLSMSFLTVQALRFAISGILPNQEGSHPRPGKTFRIFGSQKTGCCVESARAASKVAEVIFLPKVCKERSLITWVSYFSLRWSRYFYSTLMYCKYHRIHGTGIFTYIYHKFEPNVGKYNHGSYLW